MTHLIYVPVYCIMFYSCTLEHHCIAFLSVLFHYIHCIIKSIYLFTYTKLILRNKCLYATNFGARLVRGIYYTCLFLVSPQVRLPDPFQMANMLIFSQSLKKFPMVLNFSISKLTNLQKFVPAVCRLTGSFALSGFPE